MGTRCITNVIDEKGDVYVSLYRQFDGYPDGGHGEELADWLEGAHIGNGIGARPAPGFFNGVGDLAARLVTFFKDDHEHIGSFYLNPPDPTAKEEFTYTVQGRNPNWDKGTPFGEVTVKVEAYDRVLFEGNVVDYRAWITQEKNSEEDF